MEVLSTLFGGWWGPIISAAVVVLFEYFLVKPLAERSAFGLSVKVRQGKKSQTRIDQSRTIIINKVTHVHVQKGQFPSSSSGDDSDDQSALVAVVIAGVVATVFLVWLLGRYPNIITNVMLGLSIGSAVTALMLLWRYRNTQVPLGRWTILTFSIATMTVIGVRLLHAASYKGRNATDIAATVRELGFLDAARLLLEAYPFDVLGFFASQVLGAALLALLCLWVLTWLIGAVVAAAALDSATPTPRQAKLVQWLYPDGGPWGYVFLSLFLGLLGLALISGAYWAKTQELSSSIPYPSVTAPAFTTNAR